MCRTVAILLLCSAGCSHTSVDEKSAQSVAHASPRSEGDQQSPRRIEADYLPNPVQVHAKVISGGLPEGDQAFAELRSLGVKTIISVDGMQPDLQTASKYGLRYVHLPHGYDGVPDERVKELAKAVRDLEGPIYIHCHHGKHRSPAAASVACVAAGMVPQSQGVAILELAGTSSHYRGLFASAREAQPLEAALLDELEAEFPESAEVPPMAEAMVAMGHTHDHLKLIAAAGWRSPPDHPDLSPAHEALLMREHFTEMLRTDYVQSEPSAFVEYLRESEAAAQELEDALRAWTPSATDAQPPRSVQQAMGKITSNCKACHEQYRDIPLSEK